MKGGRLWRGHTWEEVWLDSQRVWPAGEVETLASPDPRGSFLLVRVAAPCRHILEAR